MKLFLPSRYSSSNCDATFLRAQREITTCSTSSSSLYSLSPPMTIKTLFPWSTRQNVLYYTFTQVTVQLRVALLLGWVKSCSFFKVLSVSHISLVPLSTPQHEEKGPSCGGEGGGGAGTQKCSFWFVIIIFDQLKEGLKAAWSPRLPSRRVKYYIETINDYLKGSLTGRIFHAFSRVLLSTVQLYVNHVH